MWWVSLVMKNSRFVRKGIEFFSPAFTAFDVISECGPIFQMSYVWGSNPRFQTISVPSRIAELLLLETFLETCPLLFSRRRSQQASDYSFLCHGSNSLCLSIAKDCELIGVGIAEYCRVKHRHTKPERDLQDGRFPTADILIFECLGVSFFLFFFFFFRAPPVKNRPTFARHKNRCLISAEDIVNIRSSPRTCARFFERPVVTPGKRFIAPPLHFPTACMCI